MRALTVLVTLTIFGLSHAQGKENSLCLIKVF